MHEFGIIEGVLKTVEQSALQAGALKVDTVRLRIGQMVEAQDESLQFAFEVLSEGTLSEGATLEVQTVKPLSQCNECGQTFDHERFNLRCPNCDSSLTTLIQGRELEIASIDIETPDDDA